MQNQSQDEGRPGSNDGQRAAGSQRKLSGLRHENDEIPPEPESSLRVVLLFVIDRARSDSWPGPHYVRAVAWEVARVRRQWQRMRRHGGVFWKFITSAVSLAETPRR